MTSLGSVSPARRTANNSSSITPRKSSGSSKKQLREYYIPASASVQELKQATLRQYEADDSPLPSSTSRRHDSPHEAISRHHQQQVQSSNNSHRAPASARNAHQQQQQAQVSAQHQVQQAPVQAARARTTSVARRIVLRGPDSAKSATNSPASPAPSRTQDHEYFPSEEATRPSNQRNEQRERREASNPSVRTHQRQPSAFRYEQEKPRISEVRQQTFRTRVNQLLTSTSKQTHHRDAGLLSSSGISHFSSGSTARLQAHHLSSPSTASTDDLDSEFILQFARDNKLELGAEVAQSLARTSTRRNRRSTLMQKHDSPSQSQQQQRAPATPQATSQQAPQRSPLLTPDMASISSPHHSQSSPNQSAKPPRPPTSSSRRLSATPSPVTPAPPAPSPRNELEEASTPARASHTGTSQSRNEDSECAYASVFDDADEDEMDQPQGPTHFQAPPVKSELYSRRTSMSSTRPSRDRRERSYSSSSRHHQPRQAHHPNTPMTPHSPTTPATPKLPLEHASQTEMTKNMTPQAQVSTSLVIDESPSEAKTLISQYDDHAREDYERNRRLSSLLKGLGIQTRSKSPEMDAHIEEFDNEEQSLEEEEIWQPVASSSNSISGYEHEDHRFAEEEGEEEQESVMLTGDSFQTAPDEEGVEIWTQGTLSRDGRRRDSNETFESQGESHDYREEEVEESDGSQSDQDYDDHDIDDKSWYEDESHRSRHSLRRSYTDKPQPLPPEYTLDEVRRSTIEQRASLGVTDSVLAGILATDSFCMPDGLRMSIEQVAARLSMDRLSKSNGSFRRTRRTTSGHTNTSLPYAGRDRYLSVASSTDLAHAVNGRKSWEQEAFPAYLSENNVVEVVQEPEGGYAEEDLPPLPPQDAEPTVPTPTKPVDLTWRQSNLSMAEAIALRPLPLELPSEDEASKPVENIPQRKRTRSVSAFQRLSSTFTGSSNKTKSRKRLPSFLSGIVGSSKNTAQDNTSKKATASPTPILSAPTKPVETSPQPSLQPPLNHKRASTGPPRLVDIANEVTNSPDPANELRAPTPSSPAESTRSKTMGQNPSSTESWRSTIPEALYATLARTHSKTELRRQEVIYELYRTEESFVNGLRGVVRVFSQPLRTPQGRWIAGVPTPIARLLDWLDDIVYLHSQVTSILAECRHAQGHVVHKLADVLLDFMPRLEVHQPYLIRFESVTKSIDDMLVRPDSDFGEFVRMQQALPECGSMPLSSFLLKPVQRLMKYPLFFKQLRDLTPAHHPDYEATQELMEMTDSMIKAMEGVKVREEEYEALKTFASKIVGLPTGLILAKRDRRLLGQGLVHRVELSDSDRHNLELVDEEAEASYKNATSQPMSISNKAVPLHSNSRRSIITDSAYGSSPRPMSYFSDAGSLDPSVSTGYSGTSSNWDGSNTFSPPIPSSSSLHSRTTSPSLHSNSGMRPTNNGASMLSPHSHGAAPPLPSKNGFPSHGRQKSMSPSVSVPTSSLRGILKSSSAMAMPKQVKHSRDQQLQVFIFNDLVLFTSATSQHSVTAGVRGLGLKPSKSSLKSHSSSTTLNATLKADATRYTVVDDWGVARLIGVTDMSGRTEHENLYKLDLLPLWSEADEKRPFTLRTAALCTSVYISLPDPAAAPTTSMLGHRRTPSTSSTMQRDVNGRPIQHAVLLEAIDRSYVHSMRDVLFTPSQNDKNGSIAARKLQRGMQGLSDSGAIPRSPSQQLFKPTITIDPSSDMPRSPTGYNDPCSAPNAAASHRPDDVSEREERQFWSYRYKKISAEQSKDGLESQIDEIIQSGLLHCPIYEIEAIINNLNGGENEDLIPDRLVSSLREIKQNEKTLRHVMKEAKKGVRMIPASNSSVGLAISYPASAASPARMTEGNDRDNRGSDDSQRYSAEQEEEELQEQHYEDYEREGFHTGRGRQDQSPYLRVDDMRYREQQQCDDEEDDEQTERSDSEYDSADQEEAAEYQDDDTSMNAETSHSQAYRNQNASGSLRSAHSARMQVSSPRAPQVSSPRIRVHASPRTQASPRARARQSPRAQPSPKVQPSPRVLQQSPRARASPRIREQQSTPTAAMSSLSMQRETSASSSSSQRYGAYHRPAATSTPIASSSSPRMTGTPTSAANTSFSSSSSSVQNTPSRPSPSPALSSSRTTPNHLALASQMRRERQASHSSPNLSHAAVNGYMPPSPAPSHLTNANTNTSTGMKRDNGRRRVASREREVGSPMMHREREREIQPSPSLETVYTVQRAQRVPLTRRL